MNNLKIIDTHFHIWDLDSINIEWIKGNDRLNKNFTFENYINEYKDINFIGGIYIEVDSNNKKDELSYINNIARQKNKVLGIVAGGNIENAKNICEMVQNKLCGFREILHINTKRIKEENFQKNIKNLDSNIVFEACIKDLSLKDLESIAKNNCNIKFVINHFGNPDYKNDIKEWENNLKSIAKLDNVFIKLSSLDDFNKEIDNKIYKNLIGKILEIFNCKKILFGSNFPVSNLKPKEWLNIVYLNLLDFGLDLNVIESIFYDNAIKCYSIKPTIQRFGQIIKVKEEKLDYYKKLHANVWSEVNDRIKKSHIKNYSIYYYGGLLFAYFEYYGFDFKKDMEEMAKDDLTKKWWKETAPCQIPLENGKQWINMEEVFHLD